MWKGGCRILAGVALEQGRPVPLKARVSPVGGRKKRGWLPSPAIHENRIVCSFLGKKGCGRMSNENKTGIWDNHIFGAPTPLGIFLFPKGFLVSFFICPQKAARGGYFLSDDVHGITTAFEKNGIMKAVFKECSWNYNLLFIWAFLRLFAGKCPCRSRFSAGTTLVAARSGWPSLWLRAAKRSGCL